MTRVVCIGCVRDGVFAHTVRKLESAGLAPAIVDVPTLCRTGEVTYVSSPFSLRIGIDGDVLDVDASSSVLSRLVDPTEGAPDDLRSRATRVIAILRAALTSRNFGAIVNPTDCDVSNYSKFFHLREYASVVSRYGVLIPGSALTNDAARAREFVSTGPSVYKGASSQKTIVSTWEEDDEARLDLLPRAPVLFQRLIRGPDLRVHVVGRRVFGELIWSDAVDYRFGSQKNRNRYQAVDVPSDIAQASIAVTHVAGCPFMGIDYKIDAQQERVFFLEANTMPAFIGYDTRANGAISSALVDYLMSAGRA